MMIVNMSELFVEEILELLTERSAKKLAKSMRRVYRAGKLVYDLDTEYRKARGKKTHQEKLKDKIEKFKRRKAIEAKRRIARRKRRLATKRKKKK
nr:hypothetical protein [Nanoarchaeota archaeon]